MSYENIAMKDARKLAFSNFKRNTRLEIEEFPTLQDKTFTPFNEVVKGKMNRRSSKQGEVSRSSNKT